MRKRKKKNHKKIPTDWESEGKKKRIRVREKTKILEKRKKKNYQKYVYGGDSKINKMKKWRKIQ